MIEQNLQEYQWVFQHKNSIIWTNIFGSTSIDRDVVCLFMPLAESSKKK
jgi:hypothetical protein